MQEKIITIQELQEKRKEREDFPRETVDKISDLFLFICFEFKDYSEEEIYKLTTCHYYGVSTGEVSEEQISFIKAAIALKNRSEMDRRVKG